MKLRVKALRSLRWNYILKGILGWLFTEWVQYIRVESSELIDARVDEVQSLEELVERRVSECGVWN